MSDQRPWYFGAWSATDGVSMLLGDPEEWTRRPVPIGDACAGGCGRTFKIDDSGAFAYDPTSGARYPVHWSCMRALLHRGHA